MDTSLCTTKTLNHKFREEKSRKYIKWPDFSSDYFHTPPQTVLSRTLFVFPRYQHYTMKFTLVITALGFFATSATAIREWSYNDHRRSVVLASLEQGNQPAAHTLLLPSPLHLCLVPSQSCLTSPAKAKHADLCKRWDGPRCLDDEDKPSPWEMNYLERKTAKIEKHEAEDAVEKIHALWNKWNAEQVDMLSKVKKGGKAYMVLLEEVSCVADVDAVTGVDARCRGSY
jgi:hypothetical protein